MKRRARKLPIISYLFPAQKRFLNQIRRENRTSYSALVRGALYEKYPELRNMR